MKKNILKSEQVHIFIFIILAIITALILDQWAFGFLVWSLVYIIWKWIEFYYFYKWYQEGAKTDNAPLNTGLWEDLSTSVIKNKNNYINTEKNNQRLIKQFDVTTQALPYATLLLNKQFEIEWVNKAAGHILGVIEHKDESNRIDNFIRDPKFVTLLHSKNETSDIKLEHPLDSSKKIYLKLIHLSDERLLLVGRDISEQESLRKSRKAFVDNASHELRTPLTVIVGYLEMLVNSKDIPQSWNYAIEQSMTQANRMERIINDMLKLSSIEHEKYLEYNQDPINMAQLLNEAIDNVKNSSLASHHKFTANIDSQLHITGNEEEIIRVCLNLLNNAVIHTKENTEISLRWFKENDKAKLWICDNGEGIEQKHLTHLTERFYRVDNSRDKNINSTGLGLAIVKQICENHNASLDIESEINKGTCFKIEFPQLRIIS